MQKANCIVRLGGELTNTVPKLGVTPAEILILRHIHGADAVVDIRPTVFDKKVRQEREYERLSIAYDNSGGFGGSAGEAPKSILEQLFPGAIKKLPTTLEEIGIDSGQAASAPEREPVPDLPPVDEDEESADDADETQPEQTTAPAGEAE